ncbi:hypothetical protein H4R34_000612 [Dimargaris verticillata]|uniref:Uncharacterized protein n=1 Tax=Dimargaris verticillata TaxID=2761393 RepID=A0A9W8B5Y8_9FUNG|nr:hypothetical protein H4R34_000612 [Dimargaris verticillata]
MDKTRLPSKGKKNSNVWSAFSKVRHNLGTKDGGPLPSGTTRTAIGPISLPSDPIHVMSYSRSATGASFEPTPPPNSAPPSRNHTSSPASTYATSAHPPPRPPYGRDPPNSNPAAPPPHTNPSTYSPSLETHFQHYAPYPGSSEVPQGSHPGPTSTRQRTYSTPTTQPSNGTSAHHATMARLTSSGPDRSPPPPDSGAETASQNSGSSGNSSYANSGQGLIRKGTSAIGLRSPARKHQELPPNASSDRINQAHSPNGSPVTLPKRTSSAQNYAAQVAHFSVANTDYRTESPQPGANGKALQQQDTPHNGGWSDRPAGSQPKSTYANYMTNYQPQHSKGGQQPPPPNNTNDPPKTAANREEARRFIYAEIHGRPITADAEQSYDDDDEEYDEGDYYDSDNFTETDEEDLDDDALQLKRLTEKNTDFNGDSANFKVERGIMSKLRKKTAKNVNRLRGGSDASNHSTGPKFRVTFNEHDRVIGEGAGWWSSEDEADHEEDLHNEEAPPSTTGPTAPPTSTASDPSRSGPNQREIPGFIPPHDRHRYLRGQEAPRGVQPTPGSESAATPSPHSQPQSQQQPCATTASLSQADQDKEDVHQQFTAMLDNLEQLNQSQAPKALSATPPSPQQPKFDKPRSVDKRLGTPHPRPNSPSRNLDSTFKETPARQSSPPQAFHENPRVHPATEANVGAGLRLSQLMPIDNHDDANNGWDDTDSNALLAKLQGNPSPLNEDESFLSYLNDLDPSDPDKIVNLNVSTEDRLNLAAEKFTRQPPATATAATVNHASQKNKDHHQAKPPLNQPPFQTPRSAPAAVVSTAPTVTETKPARATKYDIATLLMSPLPGTLEEAHEYIRQLRRAHDTVQQEFNETSTQLSQQTRRMSDMRKELDSAQAQLASTQSHSKHRSNEAMDQEIHRLQREVDKLKKERSSQVASLNLLQERRQQRSRDNSLDQNGYSSSRSSSDLPPQSHPSQRVAATKPPEPLRPSSRSHRDQQRPSYPPQQQQQSSVSSTFSSSIGRPSPLTSHIKAASAHRQQQLMSPQQSSANSANSYHSARFFSDSTSSLTSPPVAVDSYSPYPAFRGGPAGLASGPRANTNSSDGGGGNNHNHMYHHPSSGRPGSNDPRLPPATASLRAKQPLSSTTQI